jgi:galactosyl transferase GMA12/MNN10 family
MVQYGQKCWKVSEQKDREKHQVPLQQLRMVGNMRESINYEDNYKDKATKQQKRRRLNVNDCRHIIFQFFSPTISNQQHWLNVRSRIRYIYLLLQGQIMNKLPSNLQKQESLLRIPVQLIIFLICCIALLAVIYTIGKSVYWSFHHFHCYSREMNVVWDEGLAHTIKRNHSCPRPFYYKDLMKNSSSKSSVSSNAIDPSRICITSLSDGAQRNNNQKVQSSSLSIISSFITNILTVRCRDFSSVEEYTWPLTVQYCKKHGYTCYEASHLLDGSRPPAWSKIIAVYYLLTNRTSVVQPFFSPFKQNQQSTSTGTMRSACDWVLWMDADTIIMNSDVQIEDLLPPSTSLDTSTYIEEPINLIVTYDRRFTANSGIWLIRNTYWSHEFLDNWWSMTNFVRAKGFSLSGDNQAFGYLLDSTYKTLQIKQQTQQQRQQQVPIENVDITNEITSGPIRMIPRCQINSFGVFIPNYSRNKQLRHDSSKTNKTTKNDGDSNDINHLLHVNSDQYYHYGDFIAHASGIDQKEAGVKLLLKHAIT